MSGAALGAHGSFVPNQCALPPSRPTVLVLLVAVLSVAVPARANDVRELRYDLRVDIPLTVTGATLWVVGETLRGELGAATCRWCDDNVFDRGARDALLWDNTRAAARASDVTAFVIAPLAAFGGVTALAARSDALSGAWVDALIIGEATALAMALNQAIKLAAGRQRPFVHALSAEEAARREHEPEDNLSFYSGHTTFAFSLAVASGTVASMRGYRAAGAIWAVGVPVAALAGYFRIAADRHYLSDVLTGAALGSAFGFAIPYLLHSEKSAAPAMSVSASPALVSFSWVR